ncbi:hypothetical protein BpHYR1_045516 [Brachionus plicatilis]|uniref:Uncharacterized protein n=1 Tax=Brachionus plicatilis TaxID=10195 RepID=A0A3M7SFZ1_BRAPC|nr:hypothetical protein BpHYR1_045516 [Brachionus plicatilis]
MSLKLPAITWNYNQIKSNYRIHSNFYLNRQKLAQTEQLDLLNNLNNVFRLVVSENRYSQCKLLKN